MLNDRPSGEAPLVFLLDVDNTLLDNDRFSADLSARLTAEFGVEECRRYRAIYESLRDEFGYADYLAALQRFREDLADNPRLLQMSHFLLEYPFAERVYPHALDTLAALGRLGPTVIVSDGDIVFQPRKIQRSGLWDAVGGRVLIYIHKQHRLDAIQRSFPARHYVMVEDKPALLAAMKREMGERMTTVFVRQGHYAADADLARIDPPPDLNVARIGELREPAFAARIATIAGLRQGPETGNRNHGATA
jgi:FMN phosphatase YigB (HAD superfamily)